MTPSLTLVFKLFFLPSSYEGGYLRKVVRGGVLKMFPSPFRSERFRTFKNVIFSEYRSNAYVLKQTAMKNIV